ncbi:MAG: glucose-1-phosphate cytidylyltransferase [Vulcanimicrobiaceae bacterium]
MVEVGGKPLLWHLLNTYSSAGFDDFIIALGYKQEIVKEYFSAFWAHNNDLSVDLATGAVRSIRERVAERWKVDLVDTGLATMTGGRIKRLRHLIGEETFMCTYGDGLASIDASDLLAFHRREGRLATLTAVRPPARFGSLALDGTRVADFQEKPQASEGWINGGFFVFEPQIFDRIDDDGTLLEHEPLVELAREGQLSCFRHEGFWQPMDTLRDKRHLEDLWATGKAPWIRQGTGTLA